MTGEVPGAGATTGAPVEAWLTFGPGRLPLVAR
jgi:hypothetical protein